MSDYELLEQVIGREIGNVLGNINPTLKIFSSTLTNYTMNFLTPYIKAFTNVDTGELNTKAANAFAKEEINDKVDKFMKKFEEKQNEQK